MAAHFEVYPERDENGERTGKWRWRLVANNNEPVLPPEQHDTPHDAERAIDDVLGVIEEASYPIGGEGNRGLLIERVDE